MQELVITNKEGRDVTTSLKVAEVFFKNHRDVLRDIRNLECSEDFTLRNFAHTSYIHPQNKQEVSYYEITKDGFSFLVMGYTGKKAAEFKEMFIEAFNKNEALLKNEEFILNKAYDILNNRSNSLLVELQRKDERIKELEDKLKVTKQLPEDIGFQKSHLEWLKKKVVDHEGLEILNKLEITSRRDVIDIDDVVYLTGYKKSQVYKLVHESRIPYYKPNGGSKVYFKRSEVMAFLQTNRHEVKRSYTDFPRK